MKLSFLRFLNRFKFKRLRKYEQFGVTFAITYFLTIFFTVLVVLEYFESNMIAIEWTGGIWGFIKAPAEIFTFGNCKGLDAWTYLSANIVETLIPTTVTFSGTILILQTTKEANTSLNALLFISLTFFVMTGMFFMVAKLRSTLSLYIWLLLILHCIVFTFSAKLFNVQSKSNNEHKNEESDGNIIGC